jgi:hypothetical protein
MRAGLGSVLFNALNTPATLTLMMRMVILQSAYKYWFRN